MPLDSLVLSIRVRKSTKNERKRQMHARVATFEGGDPEQVREMVEEINRRSDSGPPEGVPAVGMLILHRPNEGKVLAITLFGTEEDLRAGDATLNSMDPPAPGGMGQRASVEMFEVPVKLDL
jgi:hypothetical protein